LSHVLLPLLLLPLLLERASLLRLLLLLGQAGGKQLRHV
jgi:hypothetical protein